MTLLIFLLILVLVLLVAGIASVKPSEYDRTPPDVLMPQKPQHYREPPILGGRHPHG